MDHFPSTENTRPWWEDVAHLRDDAAPSRRAPQSRRAVAESTSLAGRADAVDLLIPVDHDHAIGDEPRGRVAARTPHRASGRHADRARGDWFAQEAGAAGRRTKPRVDPSRPERPRATLVDLAPDHAFMRRAQQVRRRPGERPTVTITGRPEGALPPQVREPERRKARRTREQASALVASPDRLILWAVALGLLMILASIGTASAHAAVPLTLLK